MAEKLRFGIVGLGMGMGRARSCTNTEGAELVAVCDIWKERAEAATEEFGCEWIPKFHDLLDRSDIDVVGIWSPSGMHSSMAIEALEAGKHVCMTKPMDIETEVCDRAIETADRKGLVLAVDFDSRYRPVNHRIKSVIQSKAIGDIVMADLRMKWYRAQTYYDSGMPEAWRSRMATERGSMANQAVHYIDLLQWWMGPVTKVVGKRATRAHRIETEDAATAIVEFESGAYGSIITTTCSFPNLGTQLEFTGSSGTLSWQDQEITRFVAAQEPEAGSTKDPGYDAAFAVKSEPVDLDVESFDCPDNLPSGIIEDMVFAIRDGKPVMCDGREGRKSVAIFEAAYNSSDSGLWESL